MTSLIMLLVSRLASLGLTPSVALTLGLHLSHLIRLSKVKSLKCGSVNSVTQLVSIFVIRTKIKFPAVFGMTVEIRMALTLLVPRAIITVQ